MSEIVVTGFGIISALGLNADENRRGLLQGETAVSHLSNVKTVFADTRFYGEIKRSTEDLKAHIGITESGVTRTDLLATIAFEEAYKSAGLSKADLSSSDTALISANTVGGMCLTDEMYADARSNNGGSEYVESYDNAASTLFLQKRYGMRGHSNTFNTACSSSANAIMFGAQLIESGLAKRAIVGGVDSLAKFTINGFNALFILSPEPSKPFDAARQGLNLGEGAAFLVLEKADDTADKKVFARLSGYKNSNDAFHPSALSDEGVGPYEAMNGALQRAALKPEDISYINAHGTGTENNDLVESTAMKLLFPAIPPFSSTKAFTGHTLGAAGAIEAVYSIMAICNQEVYPNLHFQKQIPETQLQPQAEFEKREINHVMSNSFGFAGNCSSLIFSAP